MSQSVGEREDANFCVKMCAILGEGQHVVNAWMVITGETVYV